MSLRIVHVVRQYAPSVGGLEAVVSRLATEQQRRLGYKVRVVTLDRLFADATVRLPREESVDGVPVTRLAWKGSSRYPLWPQVAWHLGEVDLVHVHAIDFAFDWLALTRVLHRRPMVASTQGGFFHTSFASTLKRVWFTTITRLSCTAYRRIIAISDNDGSTFRRIAGERVVVVEIGAEIDLYRDAASQEPVRTLIYFGRWSANKGLPALLNLVAALVALDPRWRLIIAGRPYDITRSDLDELTSRLGLQDAVELHESPSDDALRTLMTRASYFACLSRHEGFGIAAIEAISAGLVPLLSDIPPFRKVVDEVGRGLLIALDEPATTSAGRVVALYDEGVATHADDRQRLMAHARRYDWSSVVDRHAELYRNVLGEAA